MISLQDYFGEFAEHLDLTATRRENAAAMLDKVNAFLALAEANGIQLDMNPATKTLVSGEQYGGFRPQDCPIGAAHSQHKEGHAVDVYDPNGDLDRWITDARLVSAGLYREAPSCTGGWTHLADVPPPSGKRTFQP